MERPTTVILLAGTIKPPPLRQEIGLPIAALPLTQQDSLLTRWLRLIGGLGTVREVRVVVNSNEDAEVLSSQIEQAETLRGLEQAAISAQPDVLPPNQILMEHSSWRGTAGLMRDMAGESGERDGLILLVETSMLPPATLAPVDLALESSFIGVVGATKDGVPNGVSAFRRDVLVHIPRVGYFDLKEQLLPRLNDNGLRVRPAWFEDGSFRVRDRRTYLDAVEAVNPPASSNGNGPRLAGTCLIDPVAQVAPGAVVHASVIMEGAIVEDGAVITRSVIGPGATVPAGERIVRSIWSNSAAATAKLAPAGGRRAS